MYSRTADHRPGGGFFGYRHGAGGVLVDELVHPLEEGYGLQVLVAALLVWDPLPLFARVVEVEHRGDGVHPQAVHVVLPEPEEGVGRQVVADLVAAVVEDERTPVRVTALTRVGVLVEVRAVEVAEAVRVFGEVGRDPVDDYSYAGRVEGVHQALELVRAPKRLVGA